MERWNRNTSDYESDEKIDAFIEEVIALSKKHGFSVEHEDAHGAFVITKHNDEADEWLRRADTEL